MHRSRIKVRLQFRYRRKLFDRQRFSVILAKIRESRPTLHKVQPRKKYVQCGMRFFWRWKIHIHQENEGMSGRRDLTFFDNRG
jgi:hypothetical protein